MEDNDLDNSVVGKKIFIDHISYWCAQLGAAIALTGMMCLVTIDVILRDIINSPIVGANDYNCLLMMITVLLSLSYCWAQRGHIRMELLVRVLSPKAQDYCWVLAALAGVVVFGFMSFQSFFSVLDAIQFNEITFEAYVILWPFRIIYFLGCLIFTVQLFTDSIRYLKIAIKSDSAT